MRIVVIIGLLALALGLGLAWNFFGPKQDMPLFADNGTRVLDGLPQQPAAPAEPPAAPGDDTLAQVPPPTLEPPEEAPQPSPVEEEAGPFRLSLPIDCVPGDNCLIFSYMNAGTDLDPRDYQCGGLTTAGERGTDFRLIDHVQMEDGVSVLAAATGTVRSVRDGMPDASYRLFGSSAVSDRRLGNYVEIDHGNGYVTTYGHIKRGTVQVGPGDVVARGDVLGQVGLSGQTDQPVLAFEVMQDGGFVDPFTGYGRGAGCGVSVEPLWQSDVADAMPYLRTLILQAGFSDRILNRTAVEYVLFNNSSLPASAGALVMHVYVVGVQPGDGFVAEITDPDGLRFVKSGRDFDSYSQVELLAIGRDNLVEPLKTGTYEGVFRFFRTGEDGQKVQILASTQRVDIR